MVFDWSQNLIFIERRVANMSVAKNIRIFVKVGEGGGWCLVFDENLVL